MKRYSYEIYEDVDSMVKKHDELQIMAIESKAFMSRADLLNELYQCCNLLNELDSHVVPADFKPIHDSCISTLKAIRNTAVVLLQFSNEHNM